MVQKNAQFKIIERMIKDGSLKMSEEEFTNMYNAHKLSIGKGYSRFQVLLSPITKSELEVVKAYITDNGLEVKDLAASSDTTIYNFYKKAQRAALKIIAQNPKILDKITVVD